MKISSTTIFNISAVLIIILLIILIILPFNINNLEQAKRIAIWKSKFEDMKYCFSLINLYEHCIVQSEGEAGKIISDDYFLERMKPYFNFADSPEYQSKKYRYRRMNGRPVNKSGQFYFKKFFKLKDNTLISIRRNENKTISDMQPSFFMYLDINGRKKPNRIGQDIFFISIFKNHIEALGHDLPYSALKTNCSPIGSGVYCSEYYILGGRF